MDIGNVLRNKNSFFSNGNSKVQDILSRSNRATCGTFEKEVVVRTENVASTKARLRSSGFMIVGTSEPNGSTRKIWFVPMGASLI